VRERLLDARCRWLLDERYVEQVGVDLEQHERLLDVGVEPLANPLPLVGATGVDEPSCSSVTPYVDVV
jgi:hypothetical protein